MHTSNYEVRVFSIIVLDQLYIFLIYGIMYNLHTNVGLYGPPDKRIRTDIYRRQSNYNNLVVNATLGARSSFLFFFYGITVL
jgi:hypothetical protein